MVDSDGAKELLLVLTDGFDTHLEEDHNRCAVVIRSELCLPGFDVAFFDPLWDFHVILIGFYR